MAEIYTISISMEYLTTITGVRQQCTAVRIYNSTGETEDITNEVVWASSNPSVASVDSNGIVTSLSVGTTNITATYTIEPV